MKAYGLSSSEYFYLLALYREDGLSQDNLTHRLFVDKAATARAVKSLETKGFVTRSKDDRDRRVNHVHLTDLAHHVRPDLLRVLKTWNTKMIDHLSDAQAVELSNNLEFISTKMSSLNDEQKEKKHE